MIRRTERTACLYAVTIALAACSLPGCGGSSPSRQPQASAPDTLRVMAYNIHHGAGMDEVLDLDRIARLIREQKPDLVALQEVDSVTTRTGGVDQARALGRLTGMLVAFGAFMPYRGGSYGMAVLSRLPIARSENLRLPDGDEPRTALSVTVEMPESKRRVRFVGIHFYRTEAERLAQANRLEDWLTEKKTATILAGDFNSRPGSKVMSWLEARWKIAPKGADRFTFPAHEPDREIDFLLYRPASRFVLLDHRLIDEPVASDHRPLVAEFLLK